MRNLQALLGALPYRTPLIDCSTRPHYFTGARLRDSWRAWFLLEELQLRDDPILELPAARLFGAILVNGEPRWIVETEGGAS